MKRIVHGATPSPFVRKVIITLVEKGLDFELSPLLPLPKTPELMALHPMGKIPVYQEGELTLPDSSVICAYLERTAPEVALYPQDPAAFGQALFLEEYADTALAETIGGIFFQRFVRANLMGEESDESIVKPLLEEALPARFDYLEGRLADRKADAGGATTLLDGFSIADVSVGAQLQGLSMLEIGIDTKRWPQLARYVEGLASRPSFQKALG